MLLVLLATLSFTTTAQENNNKKSTRQERKLERQERREKRKEERTAKRNKTTNDTVYIEVDTILQDNYQSQIQDSNKSINQEVINQQEGIATTHIESTPVKVKEEDTIPYSKQSKSNSPEQKRSASSSELSSDNSQDENINGVLIIIAIVLCVGIFKVIRWYHMHKCSSCKRRFSMKVVNEEFLGHTKKEREKGSDGKYFDIYYSNIKVTRQCKYCGHKVFYTEERKGA